MVDDTHRKIQYFCHLCPRSRRSEDSILRRAPYFSSLELAQVCLELPVSLTEELQI